TPSFFVSPSRGSYHCFGCNKGGDIISFIQDIEGLDFVGALKLLADRAGVELEPFERKNRNENEKLWRVLEMAEIFYRNNLALEKDVLKYLFDRGLTIETIKKFGLGFARDKWRDLGNFLSSKSFDFATLEKAGLVISQNSSQDNYPYDRFRNRIMFPIKDQNGKTVGFSGRIYGSRDDAAKYINSPQTPIFDKSKILYGYDVAKMEIRKKDFAVLVEGQIDLVMSHQAGVVNTVATSGTALTEDHLNLIKRLTDNLVLAFDFDLAGIKASWRAINMARALELNVKIAKLSKDLDPADVIKRDPSVWQKAVAESIHYIDFMMESLKQEGKIGLDLTLAVNEYILPYIKALDKKMEQAHFVTELSSKLNLPEQAIWQDLEKIQITAVKSEAETLKKSILKSKNRREIVEERIFGLLWSDENQDFRLAWIESLKTLLGNEMFVKKEKELSEQKDQLILKGELLYEGKEKNKVFTELLSNLKEEMQKAELAFFMSQVKQAEKSGDEKLLELSLKKCQELSAMINENRKEFNKS
ncbi:MAG: DNA primase, partial [Candidatus Paceibacterota bacterium]